MTHLTIGLSALAIPGIGPIIAAGPLVTALVGAGVGAAAGGLIGALTDIGVPEAEAHYYAEGVRRGGVLITVHAADDMAECAASVLATHHPIDLTQRVEEWRQSGWSRFDADAEPSALAHSTPAQTLTPDKAYDSKAHTVVTAAPQTREPARPPTHAAAQETTIPVVEESWQVGKRQTERDVAVRTTVTETPSQRRSASARSMSRLNGAPWIARRVRPMERHSRNKPSRSPRWVKRL